MPYTVFVPAAGMGSRLGGLTKYISKALVSIENKPALSRIMDMFPKDTEFVIAVGYKGDIVKEFLQLAYKDRKIKVVDVFPYEGEGAGLGYTIECCREHLQKPFVFCSCDTLVVEKIPNLTHNWMGYDDRDDKSQYRTISLNSTGNVEKINEKGQDISEESKPYIGLCGVYDYQLFWNAMDSIVGNEILQGEVIGLRKILEKKDVQAHKFTWFDTGVKVELATTRQRFHVEDSPNILEKQNEAIWFLEDIVIKFCDDKKFIQDRVERAKYLAGFVPSIMGYTEHMYSYKYVPGNVMSKCVSLPLFRQLLNSAKIFWKTTKLESKDQIDFYDACMRFYKEKTYERVKRFYTSFDKKDEPTVINHVWYSSTMDLLRQVDWDYMANGIPGQFHGDFHFENILYNNENDKFEFLDWRQNFGDSKTTGDVYYDLAKLLHGLIVSHELVAKEEYSIIWESNEIIYDFNRKQMLVKCEEYYYQWLEANGYDVNKVKTLTALIFLNIAALHHYPYALILIALGKEMLGNALEKK